MKPVKKFLGLIWMLLGPVSMVFLTMQAIEKISVAPASESTNTMLQWGIILFIFLPISVGLVIFGYYAVRGEYSDEQ